MKKSGIAILPFLYQFAMIFGFVSKIRLGPFTSLRIVLFVAIMVILFRMDEVKRLVRGMKMRKLHLSFFLLFGCFLITLFHAMDAISSNNTYFTPAEMLTIFISLVVMGLWSGITFKSAGCFCYVLMAVGIVQSISVFMSAVSPGFQAFIADHFLYEGFADKVESASIEDLARSPGIGIAWSSGSLVLAYCCFALVLLKIESKISTLWFGVAYALIMGATSLVGRSGLVVELVLLAYFSLSTGKVKNVLSLLLISLVGLFVFNRVMAQLDPLVAEATQRWMFAFLDSEKVGYTNEGILKGGFPEFSSQFIFGTGVTFGRYENYSFYADSGYIKSYTSIGVVGMVCYYLGILYLIISAVPKSLPKKKKFFLWLALIALYVMEYKEPFIGMFVYPWVIISMSLLWNKEQRLLQYDSTYSGRLCAQEQVGPVS